ncbi:MAG: cyclic nucleotide-binding domain-containing protein, partial [Candidatus Kapaibacterium sp.]
PEFKRVSGELITYIAEELDEIRLNEGTTLVEAGESGNAPVYIVVEGDVDVYQGDVLIDQKSRGGLVGHELILDTNKFEYTALTRNRCTLLVLRKEELLDLMSKHIEIIEAYLNILNRVEFEEEEVEIADILLSV